MGIASELRDLFDLHQQGALTEQEFREAKKAVLEGKNRQIASSVPEYNPQQQQQQQQQLVGHSTPLLRSIAIDVVTPPVLLSPTIISDDASLEGCVALANEAVLIAINAFDHQPEEQLPPPTMLPPPVSPILNSVFSMNDPFSDSELLVRRVPLSVPLIEKLESSPAIPLGVSLPVMPQVLPSPRPIVTTTAMRSTFEERVRERQLVEQQIELERQRGRDFENARIEKELIERAGEATVSIPTFDETIPYQSERLVTFLGEQSSLLAERMLSREQPSGSLISPKGSSSIALDFQLTSPTPDRKDVTPSYRSIDLYSPPPVDSSSDALLRWDSRLCRGVHLSDDGREAMCISTSTGHVVVGTTPFDPSVHTSFMWSVVLMLRRLSSKDILIGMTGRGIRGKASFALRGDGCVVSELYDGQSVGHHYSPPLGSDKDVTTVCISCRIEESSLSFTVDGM